MGNEVTLVSSADETAKDLYRTLVENGLLRTTNTKPSYKFFSSGDTDSFAKLARRFLGPFGCIWGESDCYSLQYCKCGDAP